MKERSEPLVYEFKTTREKRLVLKSQLLVRMMEGDKFEREREKET